MRVWMGRAVKTRVLAREGWRRRRCLEEVVEEWWSRRRREERDIVTLPLCLSAGGAKTTLLLHGGSVDDRGMRGYEGRRELRFDGVETPLSPRWQDEDAGRMEAAKRYYCRTRYEEEKRSKDEDEEFSVNTILATVSTVLP